MANFHSQPLDEEATSERGEQRRGGRAGLEVEDSSARNPSFLATWASTSCGSTLAKVPTDR